MREMGLNAEASQAQRATGFPAFTGEIDLSVSDQPVPKVTRLVIC